MTISVDIHLPGVSSQAYAGMIGALGPLLVREPGFLSHTAAPVDGGFHLVETWRSEEDFGRFAEQHVAPAAGAAGIVPQIRIVKLERMVTPPHTGVPREGAAAATTVEPLAGDEGRAFRLGPLTIVVKEDGSRTRQTLAVAEFRGAGFRIPPHVHTEHDESIYVLEGDLGVMLGGRTFTAKAGTSFTIPIDVPHSVWNETEAPVRFLNTIVPARYLDYFHEMAEVAKGGKLGAPEDMKRVMTRWGLKPVTG